mmetsp:Transcript_22642/g.47266  ORF Transcript_22642/g.47266 Transcript_22642/m.47266 type:complete len:350 (+) Transcript_22642:1216-2265(+)
MLHEQVNTLQNTRLILLLRILLLRLHNLLLLLVLRDAKHFHIRPHGNLKSQHGTRTDHVTSRNPQRIRISIHERGSQNTPQLCRRHHHAVRTLRLLHIKVGVGKAPKERYHDAPKRFDAAVAHPPEHASGILRLIRQSDGRMRQQVRDPGEEHSVESPEDVEQLLLSKSGRLVQQVIVNGHHPQHHEHAEHLRLGDALHAAQCRQHRVLQRAQEPVPSDHDEQRRRKDHGADEVVPRKRVAVHATMDGFGTATDGVIPTLETQCQRSQRSGEAAHVFGTDERTGVAEGRIDEVVVVAAFSVVVAVAAASQVVIFDALYLIQFILIVYALLRSGLLLLVLLFLFRASSDQ